VRAYLSVLVDGSRSTSLLVATYPGYVCVKSRIGVGPSEGAVCGGVRFRQS
jgi:hypothetical protein